MKEPDLRRACGDLRDGLGAIRNLEQLLKSVRVAPRSIQAVLPGVHASCAPLVQLTHEFLGYARKHLDVTCCDELTSYVVPRIEKLKGILEPAMSRTVNAKQRLALEDDVTPFSKSLDAAAALFDLLEEGVNGKSVSLNLAELITQSRPGDLPSTASSGRRTATVTTDVHTGADVDVTPRLAMSTIALAIGLLKPKAKEPHIAVRADARLLSVNLSHGPCDGQPVQVVIPKIVSPSASCAAAVTTSMGAEFRIAEGQSEVTLVWKLSG